VCSKAILDPDMDWQKWPKKESQEKMSRLNSRKFSFEGGKLYLVIGRNIFHFLLQKCFIFFIFLAIRNPALYPGSGWIKKKQSCGSRSRFNGVPGSGSGSKRVKMKTIDKFHLLKCWMSSFDV
jgi:hypothetical protein